MDGVAAKLVAAQDKQPRLVRLRQVDLTDLGGLHPGVGAQVHPGFRSPLRADQDLQAVLLRLVQRQKLPVVVGLGFAPVEILPEVDAQIRQIQAVDASGAGADHQIPVVL